MTRKHYAVCYRLDGVDLYLIWFSDEPDGVVIEADGSISSFRTQSDLCAYAQRRGLELEPDEPNELAFDSIEQWLARPDGGAIDCVAFLDFWNFFGDVASSIGHAAFERSPRSADGVYDKLFWGCNLAPVTPPGEHYVPAWSDVEVAEIHQVLSPGVGLIRSAVKVMV